MSDDGYSASELRKMYGRGGTVSDTELSAAQLRARHGIPNNQKDFSTRHNDAGGVSTTFVAGLVTLVVIAIVGYLIFGHNWTRHTSHEEL